MASNAGIMESPAAPVEMAHARSELRRLHFRWQHLTKEEGAAIVATDWDRVKQIEEAKERLQPEIVAAEQSLQEHASRCGADAAAIRREFHEIIEISVRLESHNRELLAAQLQQGRSRFQELRQVGHNLRQLHQAYAHQPNSVWQSYS